jgi:hypothetical protein
MSTSKKTTYQGNNTSTQRRWKRKPKSLRNLRLGPWFNVGEQIFVKFRVAQEYAADRGLAILIQCTNGVVAIEANNKLAFFHSLMGVSEDKLDSPFVLSQDDTINLKAFSPWLDF